MKLKSVVTSVTSTAGKQLLKAKHHSPTLMFAAGVVGMGATVVLACRSTLKVEEVLNQVDADLNKIEQAAELNLPNYPEKAQVRDRIVTYTKAAFAFGKLYGPAIVVGGVSIALLTGSHISLKRNLAGTTAALAALERTFKVYRKRVVDELGTEKDREFRYGVDEREVLIEGENGPETIREKVAKDGTPIMYERWFNKETSKDWSPNPENNILKIRAAQDYANHRLNAKGYLLLNDVYESLGLKPTSAGAQVGWIKDNPKGDGFVDFGCWSNDNRDAFAAFYWRGHATGVLLDFNVDGKICHRIDEFEGE